MMTPSSSGMYNKVCSFLVLITGFELTLICKVIKIYIYIYILQVDIMVTGPSLFPAIQKETKNTY